MLLLQVIIEGFTSYKDQLIADPFSPKINVIGEASAEARRSTHSAGEWGAACRAQLEGACGARRAAHDI